MATYSNIVDWEIPWTEGPGSLESNGLQRILGIKQQQMTE